MTRTLSTLDALTAFVERAYTASTPPITDMVLIGGMLALAGSGYAEKQRMIEMAACALSALAPEEREAILQRMAVPYDVIRLIGTDTPWPDPLPPTAEPMEMTDEEVTAWRTALIRSINQHAEAQAARIITLGDRKQHAYRAKEAEARRFLEAPRMDPRPEDWPYLQAEVDAGYSPDMKSAAERINEIAEQWRRLNADIEREAHRGIKSMEVAGREEMADVAQASRQAITGLVDHFLSRDAG